MSADYAEIEEGVRSAAHALRAFMNFYEQVGSIAVELAEETHPAALLLLDAMKNVMAQTGELYVEEENH